jgi:hypothetical protein
MQQRHVEQRGVQQEGEVARVGRDQQSAARDLAAIYLVCTRLIASSWSPSATSNGARIDCSWASAQLGLVSHILQEEGEQGTTHGLAPFLCSGLPRSPSFLNGLSY